MKNSRKVNVSICKKGHSLLYVQCRRRGLFFIQLTLWVVPYVVAAVGIGLSHVCTCLAGSPPPQCADGAFSHSCSLKLGAVAAISVVLAVPKM